jgi:choline dehydrogenase
MFTSLLPLSLLTLPFTLAHPSPEGSHNSGNPYRNALKREITTDASRVNGRAFDFVIAGGGCAGLALGARLSEWSNVTVLVIEAGADGSEFEERIDIPGELLHL